MSAQRRQLWMTSGGSDEALQTARIAASIALSQFSRALGLVLHV
jgi:hypothetical protein